MLNFFTEESIFMKFIRFLSVLWVLIPCVSAMAATGDFQNASKLLVAARRGDVQTVQVLVNSGVDVNYVDSTGLSLVCRNQVFTFVSFSFNNEKYFFAHFYSNSSASIILPTLLPSLMVLMVLSEKFLITLSFKMK